MALQVENLVTFKTVSPWPLLPGMLARVRGVPRCPRCLCYTRGLTGPRLCWLQASDHSADLAHLSPHTVTSGPLLGDAKELVRRSLLCGPSCIISHHREVLHHDTFIFCPNCFAGRACCHRWTGQSSNAGSAWSCLLPKSCPCGAPVCGH